MDDVHIWCRCGVGAGVQRNICNVRTIWTGGSIHEGGDGVLRNGRILAGHAPMGRLELSADEKVFVNADNLLHD